MKLILSFCFAFLAFASNTFPAHADYYLPPAQKTWMLLSDNWRVKNSSPPNKQTKLMSVNRAGKTYSWPIEKMWLADRIASNSICVGGYSALMDEYLAKLEASERNRPVLIELVKVKDQSFIAGLWLFNADAAFDLYSQHGNQKFGWSADQVKKLGKSGYESKVREVSEKNWKELAAAAE